MHRAHHFAGGVLALVLIACSHASPSGSASIVPVLNAVQRDCSGTTRLDIGSLFPGACVVQRFTDGHPQTIDAIRARRPMIINFWASWCVYCIKEMPDL